MPIIRLDQLQQFAAINVLSDPGALGGPVVIPNCVQIVLNWGLAGGKIGHNVLYGRAPGIPAPTAAQAESIRAAITSGAAWTNLASHFAPSTLLSGVSLRSVHAQDQPIVSSTGAAVAGSGTGPAMPDEVALCVTLRTAQTGRSNRGRVYIPGWNVGQVAADNTADSAAMSSAAAWVNTFRSVFAAAGYVHVIGHPARAAYTGSTGTTHPARTAGSIDVVSAEVRDNHWDSQRRRGLK